MSDLRPPRLVPPAIETGPSNPGTAIAAALRAAKSAVIDPIDDTVSHLGQHGGVMIDADPMPWPAIPTPPDTVIETFVVNDPSAAVLPAEAGSIAAMGDNAPFIDAWTPLVEFVAATVANTAVELGVTLAGPAYITVSATWTNELTGTPHFDDDMFDPDAGIGLIALAAQGVGTRIATEAVPVSPVRPGSQVTVDASTLQRFAEGAIGSVQAPPDELVLFAQFGQLHSGPSAADFPVEPAVRQLVVYRSATQPTRPSAPEASGPIRRRARPR